MSDIFNNPYKSWSITPYKLLNDGDYMLLTMAISNLLYPACIETFNAIYDMGHSARYAVRVAVGRVSGPLICGDDSTFNGVSEVMRKRIPTKRAVDDAILIAIPLRGAIRSDVRVVVLGSQWKPSSAWCAGTGVQSLEAAYASYAGNADWSPYTERPLRGVHCRRKASITVTVPCPRALPPSRVDDCTRHAMTAG